MKEPSDYPPVITWEFIGEGRLNPETGNIHYREVKVRGRADEADRRYFVGHGVWVRSSRDGISPWVGVIGDLFLEPPRADGARTGRVGVKKMRMTLRWMYTREDVFYHAMSSRAHDLPVHPAELYYSDHWTHGANCVEDIEGRAWFADSREDLYRMSVRPPADLRMGDRPYLVRSAFYYKMTAEVVRQLLDDEIGDLSPPKHAPSLPNLLA